MQDCFNYGFFFGVRVCSGGGKFPFLDFFRVVVRFKVGKHFNNIWKLNLWIWFIGIKTGFLRKNWIIKFWTKEGCEVANSRDLNNKWIRTLHKPLTFLLPHLTIWNNIKYGAWTQRQFIRKLGSGFQRSHKIIREGF